MPSTYLPFFDLHDNSVLPDFVSGSVLCAAKQHLRFSLVLSFSLASPFSGRKPLGTTLQGNRRATQLYPKYIGKKRIFMNVRHSTDDLFKN